MTRGRRIGAEPHQLRSASVATPVLEGRGVSAYSLEVEGERSVGEAELVCDELLAATLVPWDRTGDLFGPLVGVADRDADEIADAQALPPARAVDLDLDRTDSDEIAWLSHPREPQPVATEPAGHNPRERVPLVVGRARLQVE